MIFMEPLPKTNLRNNMLTTNTLNDHLQDIPELSNKPWLYTLDKQNLKIHTPYSHYEDKLNKVLTSFNITASKEVLRYATKNTPHPKIKNIIAIASGKGGVGKSTCTYFIAQALKEMGASVGILDADIHGPSQSLMFNLKTKPEISQDKYFIPFMREDIAVMSIGVLASTTKAMMWRGPMISQALNQLYSQTLWPELDYLLIDMPPGTGDISLTLVQKIPVTAAILISQPHPLATLDVEKSRNLFTHHSIPVLQTVINMSGNTCPHCQKTIDLPQPDTLTLPFADKFRDIAPIAHTEFITLSEIIVSHLAELPKASDNPFASFNIDKQ